MVIAIGILVAAVCVAVATIPFLKYRGSRQTVDPLQVISDLQGRRQQIFKELLDLEAGASAGSIPEPEFNAVSQTLRRRAAENLWLQHRWEERLTDLDMAVERFIASRRYGLSPEEGGGSLGESCAECNASIPRGYLACPKCGARSEAKGPAL